jgi:hypothetical protein
MRIIRAVVAGERDPAVLATHRDRRCHASEEEIAAALAGNWREAYESPHFLKDSRWPDFSGRNHEDIESLHDEPWP